MGGGRGRGVISVLIRDVWNMTDSTRLVQALFKIELEVAHVLVQISSSSETQKVQTPKDMEIWIPNKEI